MKTERLCPMKFSVDRVVVTDDQELVGDLCREWVKDKGCAVAVLAVELVSGDR